MPEPTPPESDSVGAARPFEFRYAGQYDPGCMPTDDSECTSEAFCTRRGDPYRWLCFHHFEESLRTAVVERERTLHPPVEISVALRRARVVVQTQRPPLNVRTDTLAERDWWRDLMLGELDAVARAAEAALEAAQERTTTADALLDAAEAAINLAVMDAGSIDAVKHFTFNALDAIEEARAALAQTRDGTP